MSGYVSITADPTTSCDTLTDWNCCSSSNPCTVGQGDCDSDSDCQGSLICGHNTSTDCPSGAPGSFDCCIAAPAPPSCDTLTDWTCCTSANPCTIGQGDCDSDSDCQGNLICGHNTSTDCPSGAPGSFDCCIAAPPPPSCDTLTDWACCTSTNPCTVGQGDCDFDSDCQGSLVCGHNTSTDCPSGAPGSFDCCIAP